MEESREQLIESTSDKEALAKLCRCSDDSGSCDACPCPRPEGYDSLLLDWGQSTYVNPPFSGPTAWVRKSIAESEKGKRVVFVFPVDKWILMLLTHPNLKEVRNLKDVKWCAVEDGSPGKGMGRHIAQFILEPNPNIISIENAKEETA